MFTYHFASAMVHFDSHTLPTMAPPLDRAGGLPSTRPPAVFPKLPWRQMAAYDLRYFDSYFVPFWCSCSITGILATNPLQ